MGIVAEVIKVFLDREIVCLWLTEDSTDEEVAKEMVRLASEGYYDVSLGLPSIAVGLKDIVAVKPIMGTRRIRPGEQTHDTSEKT